MTEARVERVHADKVRAREFLSQAEDFLADAGTASLSSASRTVLLHNATIAACDAVMQAAGLRITAGDRGHVLRLEAAMEHLGGDEDLLEDLDASRERRNEASYAAAFIAEASVVDAHEATSDLIARARHFVG